MIWNREPALFFGLLGAFLAIAAAWGLEFSTAQSAALYTALAAVMGFVIRQRVSPTA